MNVNAPSCQETESTRSFWSSSPASRLFLGISWGSSVRDGCQEKKGKRAKFSPVSSGEVSITLKVIDVFFFFDRDRATLQLGLEKRRPSLLPSPPSVDIVLYLMTKGQRIKMMETFSPKMKSTCSPSVCTFQGAKPSQRNGELRKRSRSTGATRKSCSSKMVARKTRMYRH